MGDQTELARCQCTYVPGLNNVSCPEIGHAVWNSSQLSPPWLKVLALIRRQPRHHWHCHHFLPEVPMLPSSRVMSMRQATSMHYGLANNFQRFYPRSNVFVLSCLVAGNWPRLCPAPFPRASRAFFRRIRTRLASTAHTQQWFGGSTTRPPRGPRL